MGKKEKKEKKKKKKRKKKGSMYWGGLSYTPKKKDKRSKYKCPS